MIIHIGTVQLCLWVCQLMEMKHYKVTLDQIRFNQHLKADNLEASLMYFLKVVAKSRIAIS